MCPFLRGVRRAWLWQCSFDLAPSDQRQEQGLWLQRAHGRSAKRLGVTVHLVKENKDCRIEWADVGIRQLHPAPRQASVESRYVGAELLVREKVVEYCARAISHCQKDFFVSQLASHRG